MTAAPALPPPPPGDHATQETFQKNTSSGRIRLMSVGEIRDRSQSKGAGLGGLTPPLQLTFSFSFFVGVIKTILMRDVRPKVVKVRKKNTLIVAAKFEHS